MTKNLLKDSLFVLLISTMLFSLFLGNRPFAAPDEGRYVEIPREMVADNDYITPRLNGVKYFEKPVLFYWMQTIPMKLFGINEISMRLVVVLLSAFGCLAVYLAGRALFDRRTGLFSSLILATSALYFALAHLIILDMAVTVLLSAGLLLFITGMQQPPGWKRRLSAYGVVTFLALAGLTKGLMSIAVFSCVFFLWATITRSWKKILPLYLPSAFCLFWLIFLPWHILVYLETPAFFEFYFIQEHIMRYLTNVHGRTQPFWFYAPVILAGFFPWITFLPATLKDVWHKRREDTISAFLIIWALFVFIWFSLADSKLIPYMLPAFPPLSILVGRYLSRSLQKKSSLKGPFLSYSFLCWGLIILYMLWRDKIPVDTYLSLYDYIQALIIVCALSGIIVPLMYFKKGSTAALVTLAMSIASILLVVVMASPYATRVSAKNAAIAIKKTMPQDTEVISYNHYFQDLPVYLNHTVGVYGWRGELTFGQDLEPHKSNRILEDDLIKKWHGKKPVCLVSKSLDIPTALTDTKPRIISTNHRCYVLCNQPQKDT